MKDLLLNKCFTSKTLNYYLAYFLKSGKLYQLYYEVENEEITRVEISELCYDEIDWDDLEEVSMDEFNEPLQDLSKIIH